MVESFLPGTRWQLLDLVLHCGSLAWYRHTRWPLLDLVLHWLKCLVAHIQVAVLDLVLHQGSLL